MEGRPYERNEQRSQDVRFVRLFLEQMNQTRVLRWRNLGEPAFVSVEDMAFMKETVSEHIGQMMVLATGILQKARQENDVSLMNIDLLKVTTMISLHDIEETVIGDARHKDERYYALEKKAQGEIEDKLEGTNIEEPIVEILQEYRDKSSKEARFVKAIDEIQAWMYLIYTKQIGQSTRNFKKPEDIKGYEYAAEFSTLKRIADILLRVLQNVKSDPQQMPNLELLKAQYMQGQPEIEKIE
jgi:5'-deoxynucleotidase YfbR-like HD superfamily hydrolase